MRDPTDQQFVLKTVRDVVGEAGLKALEAEKGGTEVWITLDPNPDHWMSRIFGHVNAQEIARRLTVINADGNPTCNLRCYVGFRNSRWDEYRRKTAQEVSDALLSGQSVRDVTKSLRVSERQVRRQLTGLIDDGSLKMASLEETNAAVRRSNATFYSSVDQERRKAERQAKTTHVDEYLLQGYSNKRTAEAARVGVSFVRLRRKVLVASGRMKSGPLIESLPDRRSEDRVSDGAAPPTEEVRP